MGVGIEKFTFPKPRPSFKGIPMLNTIAYRPVLSFLKLCMYKNIIIPDPKILP